MRTSSRRHSDGVADRLRQDRPAQSPGASIPVVRSASAIRPSATGRAARRSPDSRRSDTIRPALSRRGHPRQRVLWFAIGSAHSGERRPHRSKLREPRSSRSASSTITPWARSRGLSRRTSIGSPGRSTTTLTWWPRRVSSRRISMAAGLPAARILRARRAGDLPDAVRCPAGSTRSPSTGEGDPEREMDPEAMSAAAPTVTGPVGRYPVTRLVIQVRDPSPVRASGSKVHFRFRDRHPRCLPGTIVGRRERNGTSSGRSEAMAPSSRLDASNGRARPRTKSGRRYQVRRSTGPAGTLSAGSATLN